MARARYRSRSRGANRYDSGCSESASARPMTNDANEHSFPAVTSITRLARESGRTYRLGERPALVQG
jgi:hypothetical protein